VYGHGFVQPKGGDPELSPDLTADFVNWSFDPRTGKAKVLKLPGNVSVLDRSPDGKVFLVLRYEMPPGTAPGAPRVWADYRLGLLPVEGGDLIPLTKLGESTPGEFRFSPDGRSALGTMYRKGKEGGDLVPELIVFDLKSKTRTAVIVPKDAHVCGSCWSPDGKRVAYIWESEAAYMERNNRFGPVMPGQEKKPAYTVTVAKSDGSDAKDVFTETEYGYGSIDWSGRSIPHGQPPGGAEKPKADEPNDEAAVKSHIKALGDINSETRAAAAAELRRLVAKYPSGTIDLASKDGGEAAWREKVSRIGAGMTKAEVLKILPEFAEAPETCEISSGNSHIVMYRLDYHWVVTIYYRNPDKVIEQPTLTKRALQVHVTPPQNFTGTWITWHVNGQKGVETQYKNGKYDGVLTKYHDNGRKNYEQHYVNDVIHGTDTGWFPNGKVSYTARYSNGKKEGTWTHWYANGNKHSETDYANGVYYGRDSRWHENGQLAGVNDYKDGVKHGLEASWDEKGTLHYERTFENGKIVDKPPPEGGR
jgi:antitoxin component YwqK of YwqJK toxin-antitoxin module